MSFAEGSVIMVERVIASRRKADLLAVSRQDFPQVIEDEEEESMVDSTVYMPGIVLSSLMFQHLNTDSDAEGFILGESKGEEKRAITDSSNDHVYFEHTIHVQKHIPCNKIQEFYNAAGKVDMVVLRKMLPDNMQDHLIGWYRQRRNTEQQMTLRERLVTEDLKRAVVNPELIFLLLTSSAVSSAGSTHETEYAAFRCLKKVPVVVNNLGSLEDVVYRTSCTPCSAGGYQRVVQKHRSKFFSPDDTQREVMEIINMYSSMQAELQRECVEVEKSEQEVQTLLTQLTALRKLIPKKKPLIPAEVKKADVLRPSTRSNVLLESSLKRRFPHSPLLHTHTLTLQGVPVADRLPLPPASPCPHVASGPEP